MNKKRFYDTAGIIGTSVLLTAMISGLVIGVVYLARVSVVSPPTVQPPAAVRQPAQQHVPVVTVNKPPDPNNHAYSFAACARGGTGSCIQVGAWMIEQAKMGRTLEMCVKASEPQEDQPVPVVEHCTGIEARWPN